MGMELEGGTSFIAETPERRQHVFLIEIVPAAQTPPPDQARQLKLKKETMRRAEAQTPAFTILGFPMLNPVRPDPILWPPLKKMGNK
jgi:hypothetical protein